MGVEHYRRRAAVTTTTKTATTTTAGAVSKPRSSVTPMSLPPTASQELDNNAGVMVLLESFDAKLLALEREQLDVIAAMQKVAYGSPDHGINRRNTRKKDSSTTTTTLESRGGRGRSLQHQANLGHRFKEIKKEEARLRKERHHVLLQLDGGDDDCHAYGIISGGGRRRSSSRLQSIGSDASTDAGGWGSGSSTPFWRFLICHSQQIAITPEEVTSEVAILKKKAANASKLSGVQQVDDVKSRLEKSEYNPARACFNTLADGSPLDKRVHQSFSEPGNDATIPSLTVQTSPSSPQSALRMTDSAPSHINMSAESDLNELSIETEGATLPEPLTNRRSRSAFRFGVIGTRKTPVVPYYSPRLSSRRARRPNSKGVIAKDKIFRVPSAISPTQSKECHRSHSLTGMEYYSLATTPEDAPDTRRVQRAEGWDKIVGESRSSSDIIARSKKGVPDVSPAADSSMQRGRWLSFTKSHYPSSSEKHGKHKYAFLEHPQAAESVETYSMSDFSSHGSTEAETREDPSCVHLNQEVLLQKTTIALPEVLGDTTAKLLSSTVQQTQEDAFEDQQTAQIDQSRRMPLSPPRLLSTSSCSSEGEIFQKSVSEAVNSMTSEGCALVSPVPSLEGRLDSESVTFSSDSESSSTSANITQTKEAITKITSPETCPIFEVKHKVDLTYGLGFLRVDGTVGVLFKDKTRIYLEPDRLAFSYMEHPKASSSTLAREEVVGRERKAEEARSSVIRHRLDFYPFYLNKKVSALKHFRTFYQTSPGGVTAGTAERETGTSLKTRHAPMKDVVKGDVAPPQVLVQRLSSSDFVEMERLRNGRGGSGLFRVNDKMMQVLYQDGTEIMLQESMRLITFVDEAGERETIAIQNAQHLCSASVIGIGNYKEAGGSI